jgi:hypothetical protein
MSISMFPAPEPRLARLLRKTTKKTTKKSGIRIDSKLKRDVGDIRQPWIDLGSQCAVTRFTAKALFAFGIMIYYVDAANRILRHSGVWGLLPAYGLLCTSVELLGRCTHPKQYLRQHPSQGSGKRLEHGLERCRMSRKAIIATNHHEYNVRDLTELRNLVVHGACISRYPDDIKVDIELLHELRRSILGTPKGEERGGGQRGPLPGALDKYWDDLQTQLEYRRRLASAGITPVPLQFEGFTFDRRIIGQTKELIRHNLSGQRLPISGSHARHRDYFQLYFRVTEHDRRRYLQSTHCEYERTSLLCAK